VRAIINSYLDKELTEESQKATLQKSLIKMKDRLKSFHKDECDDSKQFSYVTEFLVFDGKPSEEVLSVAEEDKADMIVMGKSTRKVRGIGVMGSTARRVSRMAMFRFLLCRITNMPGTVTKNNYNLYSGKR
jgi:nucleotide-binding universal stress UspA family protein